MCGTFQEVGDDIVNSRQIIWEGDRFGSEDQDARGYDFLCLYWIMPREGPWVSLIRVSELRSIILLCIDTWMVHILNSCGSRRYPNAPRGPRGPGVPGNLPGVPPLGSGYTHRGWRKYPGYSSNPKGSGDLEQPRNGPGIVCSSLSRCYFSVQESWIASHVAMPQYCKYILPMNTLYDVLKSCIAICAAMQQCGFKSINSCIVTHMTIQVQSWLLLIFPWLNFHWKSHWDVINLCGFKSILEQSIYNSLNNQIIYIKYNAILIPALRHLRQCGKCSHNPHITAHMAMH